MKESTRVLLALGLALALGAVVAVTGAPGLLRLADGIAPIGVLWINGIRMTVFPLVISLLITGIASAADVREIGRIGTRTIATFLLMLAFLAVVVIPLSSAAFRLLPAVTAPPPLPPGASEAAGEVAAAARTNSVGAWVTTLLPSNPIAAAAAGQLVPLVLFTVLLALAIVRSSEQSRATLAGFFTALADALLVLVRWVVLAAPIGVFALVLPLAARSGQALIGGIGFYTVLYMIASLAMSLVLYPVVAIAGGVPMATFARAMLRPQLLALSTSSSIAVMPTLIEAAQHELGVSPKVTGFVLPLAASTFKPAAPVSWTVGTLFVSWFYNIPLHLPQLAIIGFAAVFLSFAGPGVPRGAFIMLAPLLTAVGLPAEGVGVLIAVDAIPDTCATVLNVTGDMAATVIVGRGELAAAPVALAEGSAPI